MSAHDAMQAFEENLKRLGANGFKTDPEKFNLYAGLLNLAEEVMHIRSEVQTIKQALARR